MNYIQGQSNIQPISLNYSDISSQRRSFSPQDGTMNQFKTQAQMQMSFGNYPANQGQLNQNYQSPQFVQITDQKGIQDHQNGINLQKSQNKNQGFHSHQNSSGNNSLQIGQLSSIQNNSATGVNLSDQINFQPSINFNVQDDANQYASIQSFSPLVNRIMNEDQKFQTVQSANQNNNVDNINSNYVNKVGGGSFAPSEFSNQDNLNLVQQFSDQVSSQQSHQNQKQNITYQGVQTQQANNFGQFSQQTGYPVQDNSKPTILQQNQQMRVQHHQSQSNQLPSSTIDKSAVRTNNFSNPSYLNAQTMINNSIQPNQVTISSQRSNANNMSQNTKINGMNNYLQDNNANYSTAQSNAEQSQLHNQILVDRKKIDNLIEQNEQLFSQVSELQKTIEIQDKTIQNTYHIAFLDSKDQKFDLMKMMECYVLICAENEKLSFGFIEKLQKIDELNVEISEKIQQKEDWKTLYEGKCHELTKSQMSNNNIKSKDDQMQKLIQENDQLRQELKVEIKEKEELLIYNREQTSIQQNLPEVNLKVCDLEDKLLKILDENEQLNNLLRERVDEVEYLQSTIRQIQETYQENSSADTRFQKVIKDLENEIRRMDERMEEIIREKENEISAKVSIEEENNQLRIQYQLKRQELEEYKISSGTSQTLEVQLKKKQEQIEELLIKLDSIQRNQSVLQEQKETFLFESKTTKEQLIKLERRYDEKLQENMNLLSKNSELQNSIKLIKGEKDQTFLEKDLKQITFEKKQLEILINELQYEKERIGVQLGSTRKEIEDLNKQLVVQRQRYSESEHKYKEDIEKLKQEQFKDTETYRFKAKIEVQEDIITNLKNKLTISEEKLNEKQLELEESKLLIKELKTKLERTNMIENTLHTVDKENQILQSHNEESSIQIQTQQEKILRISIENERLHTIIEQINGQLDQFKGKLNNQDKFNIIEINKIEEEMKEERIQFQEVIRNLEQQLKERDSKNSSQNLSEKQQLEQIKHEFLALQQEFQLAIETLKAKDQQIFVIENKYNQLISGDRTTYIITKLEEKLQILSAENYRLNKIIVDRIRHSNSNVSGW